MPRVSASTLGLGLPLSLPQQGSNLNARGLRWDGNALRRWMSVEYRAHVRVEHHGVAKSTLETIDLDRFASTYIALHCREEARERETARRYVYLSMLNAHDRDGERQRGKASIPLSPCGNGWVGGSWHRGTSM